MSGHDRRREVTPLPPPPCDERESGPPRGQGFKVKEEVNVSGRRGWSGWSNRRVQVGGILTTKTRCR